MLKCPHCGRGIPNSLITAHSGQIGGKRTAKRGSAYFRKIAGMRKHRRGGRPKAEKPFKPKEIVVNDGLAIGIASARRPQT